MDRSKPKSYIQRYKAKRLHVQVWEAANGPVPRGYHIDHINGDIHDNRLENLRLATPSQNISNSKMSTANKTGLKGLSWDVARRRWRGSLTAGGDKHTMRGDLLTVAAWLHTKRVELHGDFARFR